MAGDCFQAESGFFSDEKMKKFALIAALALSLGSQALVAHEIKDDPSHQYEHGRAYENGEGVAKDDATAVKWYRMAAGQG